LFSITIGTPSRLKRIAEHARENAAARRNGTTSLIGCVGSIRRAPVAPHCGRDQCGKITFMLPPTRGAVPARRFVVFNRVR
jgi:hypothetical protein